MMTVAFEFAAVLPLHLSGINEPELYAGTDGGGSVRIPSSLCGCVGLMPTAGRVSHMHGPSIDQTVSAIGPIAGSVQVGLCRSLLE